MTKKKLAIGIGVVVVVAGLLLWRIQSASSQQGKIETAVVETRAITEKTTSSGKTKALEEVSLHFQASGKLGWVGVKEGDIVSANQVVASLDKDLLTMDMQKALRDYSKERNDFEEDKNITYKNQLFDDTIRRILEKNQWDLEKAVLDVELKDEALKLATLTTPVSGVVTKISTPVAGVNVLYTDTFTITNPDSLVFRANIDETDVGKISIGQKAEVALDAYPDKTFVGEVTKIAYAAEVSSGGATVFPVDVKIIDYNNLLVGLNGDVSIIISETPQALSVPSEAIKENNSGQYVIKKTNDKYEKISVTTGVTDDTYIQITSGLNKEDVVVIKGFEYLSKELQK